MDGIRKRLAAGLLGGLCLGGLCLAGTTCPPVLAQAAPPTVPPTVTPPGRGAESDLNALIQANLQEAATLRAELSSVQSQPAAYRIFRTLMQSHLNQASRLEARVRLEGNAPIPLAPPAVPTTGGFMAVVQDTVTTEEANLNTVRAMEARPVVPDPAVLRQQDQLLQHNINLLRSLVAARLGTSGSANPAAPDRASHGVAAASTRRTRAYGRLQRARRTRLNAAARRRARLLHRRYRVMRPRRFRRYRPRY